MLMKFENIDLTPALARKLLLLNEIMPMDIPEGILEIASNDLIDNELFGEDTEYFQFLDDNRLRGIVLYSNFEKFLTKTIKFIEYKNIKNVLFVFDNIILNSNIISKVMKQTSLTYKVMPASADLVTYEDINVYFVDINTMKKIKHKIFNERAFNLVLLEAHGMFKSQYILDNEMRLMPHIISFTDQIPYIGTDHSCALMQYIFDKILGEETFAGLLISNKWKRWAIKRGYNINEDIIHYVSGISKHLKA